MEDISTTAGAYSKDELAAMLRHPIVAQVEKIIALQLEIEEIIVDNDRSKNEIESDVKDRVEAMTEIWLLMGPAIAIARRLFPDRGHLFDMLDNARSLKESFSDWASGRVVRGQYICDKLCCKKQLL